MGVVNQTILYVLAVFMLIGAFDRTLKQFESSGQFLRRLRLGWFGDAIDGAGKQFEDGLGAMGPLALAMVGVIAATPIISRVLAPLVIPVFTWLGASPSMFATSLLAVDMGGYGLARELATTNGALDWPAFLYSGLILGSMMGATIVFTIPVGLGMIDTSDRRPFALGILAGLVTIPVGCLAGGLAAMFSHVASPDGQPIVFTVSMLLRNLVPVVLFSGTVAVGLWRLPDTMVRLFGIFAKVLVALMTAALAVVAFQVLTGVALVPGMDPVFPVKGDQPGLDMRAMEVVCRIAIVLLGAYPAVYLVSRWCRRPLVGAGRLLGINDVAAAGLVATLASNLPMFKVLSQMDERGKVINVAFSVGAAWVFADHLAFVAANKPDMIVAVIVGKLVAGALAIAVAMRLTRVREPKRL